MAADLPLDFDTLRFLWWGILGFLLIGFAVMDGFDLGLAALLPFIARNDIERRVLLETVEPVWDGNQVWFILGGGAAFAAWPLLYAASFSGFYGAMFLVLAAFILRPVGFMYRNKLADPRWRSLWDWALFIGGVVPALVFGIAFGNLLQGVPFHFDDSLRVFYTGSFFGLLNPFALLCGVVSLVMLVMHGAVYIVLKTENPMAGRAKSVAAYGALGLLVLFTLAGLWITYGIEGFVITSQMAHDGPSNPLYKSVALKTGAWLDNYTVHPFLMAAPLAVYGGALATVFLLWKNRPGLGFITSALAVSGVIATAGVSLFPFLMPSASAPGSSLTVWDTSSSHMTLFVMLVATLFFMPLIIAYTSWVFRVLRGKVTAEHLEDESY